MHDESPPRPPPDGPAFRSPPGPTDGREAQPTERSEDEQRDDSDGDDRCPDDGSEGDDRDEEPLAYRLERLRLWRTLATLAVVVARLIRSL